jgi:hypothetical protein
VAPFGGKGECRGGARAHGRGHATTERAGGGPQRGGGNRVGNWARSATPVREEEGGGSGGMRGSGIVEAEEGWRWGMGERCPDGPRCGGNRRSALPGTRDHTMPQTECGNNRATRQTVAVGSAARERFQVSDVVGRKKGFVEKATEGKGGGEWMAYVAVAAVVESQTPDWPPPPDGRCAAGHSGKGHGTNQNPE